MLVVKSKIKDAAKGCNVSSSFADALDKKVDQLIKRACERAEANKRKTIMPHDL